MNHRSTFRVRRQRNRPLWVVARLDIDDALTGAEVEAMSRYLEEQLEQRSPFVGRVDVAVVRSATQR